MGFMVSTKTNLMPGFDDISRESQALVEPELGKIIQ